METKYLCIKDCSIKMSREYKFTCGEIHLVKTWNGSKFYYMKLPHELQINVSRDFIEQNFVLADDDNLLLTEVDFLFENILFSK